jgi:high affinity Mn2+ porin
VHARPVLLTAAGLALARVGSAAAPPDPQEQAVADWFAIHGQFTYTEQETGAFSAPYRGTNSLTPDSGRETTDATLFLGSRLWNGAEAWLNPEIDQGFGLDGTVGAAGFPSGEAYKVGRNKPYLRLQRAFIRQTVDLAGERQSGTAAANDFGGEHSVNRWVVTVGKFSVGDVFDNNQYAHDPRGDFLNWAAIDAGSFDYAADAWAYTLGAAAEWYQGSWTLRAGVFDLSKVPNGEEIDYGFHQFQAVLEIERRHELAGHPGKIMITAFNSRGRMGVLDQAVQLAQATGAPVDIAAVRRYRSRPGADVNIEQQLSPDLGLFARVGAAAGNVEAFEFTDIDRSASLGLSLKGTAWKRTQDTLGVALIGNEISAARERYLAAGGLGILVGDGRLPHPGPEEILESYYSLGLLAFAQVSLDYQWIRNPAYNRDRGPVSVFAIRAHLQF